MSTMPALLAVTTVSPLIVMLSEGRVIVPPDSVRLVLLLVRLRSRNEPACGAGAKPEGNPVVRPLGLGAITSAPPAGSVPPKNVQNDGEPPEQGVSAPSNVAL